MLDNSLSPDCIGRINEDKLSLYSHPLLVGKFRIIPTKLQNEVEIQFFHMQTKSTLVKFTFTNSYPHTPPKVDLLKSQIPSFFSFCQKLRPNEWSCDSKLADVVLDIYENIHKFYLSQKLVNDNFQVSQPVSIKNQKHRRKNTSMNGCSDRQMTETKNLNRHFRSKLRDVLKDMGENTQKLKDHMEDYKEIESMFTPNRVGFQDIRNVLKNDWFRKGVNEQIKSGRFLNKILTGMMGIKSKKLMIKYYHVIISAADDPDTFIRWKYD